ncbi:cellulase-like protein 10 [Elsinoe australis]|uniref:glucan 1,3-beta-glucosidase n=1 Tax=Elsinoe australis TaxID=40998 RepID=A0A4U7AK57_9PEZI|nr:cellulase-like protein 10 [Elsinoe australis]
MPREGGYRRPRSGSRDVYGSDRDLDREIERERRRRKKAAHTSADSSAELLGGGSPARGYRDSPSPVKRRERSDSSPNKGARRYRDESSPEKGRRAYRREDGREEERERERRRRREERRRERQRERERERADEVEVVEYPASSGVNSEMERYAARERMREERRRRENEEREREVRDTEGEREREREARREEKRRRRREERRRDEGREEDRRRLVNDSETSNGTPAAGTSNTLSMGSLAALNAMNEKKGFSAGEQRIREEVDDEEMRRREKKRRREEERRRRRGEDGYESERRDRAPDVYDEYLAKEERYQIDYIEGKKKKRDKKGRVVSGQKLEKGGTLYDEKSEVSGASWWWQRKGGSGGSEYTALSLEEQERMRKRRRRFFIILAVIAVILAIAIPVGVVVSKKESAPAAAGSGGSGTTTGGKPSNANLQGVDPNSVPADAKGTWLDPFSWYDTTDFNVTFTDEMIGGLPVIGLNSSWDDSTRANSQVPPLNEKWDYGKMPIRGINVGGWLVMEPLITPSFFSKFKTSDGVVDEYSLAAKMAPGTVKNTFETHYSSFLTEQDFKEIQDAGFDHVRIPYGYWAVITYPGDPYVPVISWRYLLRSIEWARKYGLRIKLDMHGAPGSQNGWNHSGKQGDIGWLNGTDGTLNGQRTADIHDRLSKFFAQPRYKNIITIWGLVNEPKMTFLDVPTVLAWTKSTVSTIRANGITATIAFGDGFMGLDNWAGKLQDVPNLVLDVHQYVIFNVQQLVLDHQAKTNFACGGWTAQAVRSSNKATGFGPTMFAEWSQADTDCAVYLNNVGVGSRWEGTLNMANTPGGSTNGSVLTPTCPTNNSPRCSCREANADPGQYSDVYKQWLREFAEAQMESFEKGWGWFYWTWRTEGNAQWSYRDGLKNGILPGKTWERSFSCGQGVPDYAAMGLPEYY